jgi:lipopolysaccharide O-acetyltransferase
MKDLLHTYNIFQIIKIFFFFVRTKIYYPKARIIRFPIDIRGKKYINFGKQLTTGKACRIEAYPKTGEKQVLIFGNNVQLNDYVHITAMENIEIGNNVLIASKVYIADCVHGSYKGDTNDSDPIIPPIQRNYSTQPVIIENNVWIGEFVSILPGVTIGEGSIIGTMSVVTKNIPPYVIAVGSPAKPIKQFNFETQRWEKI